MRLSDWLMALVIIIIFSVLVVYAQLSGKMDEIKENWHLYKCNPVMIPFAGYFGEDPGKTMQSCIVGASSGFVQNALGPIMTIFSSLAVVAEKQEESTNNSRKQSKNIRSKMSGLGGSLFGMVFSFSSEMSRLGLKIKDSMSKMTGVVATMVHVMTTSMETMNSIWKGPPGQTLRFVGGMCFERNTLVRLEDGRLKKMMDIDTGDVLVGGTTVFGTMKLLNRVNGRYLDDMYVFERAGELCGEQGCDVRGNIGDGNDMVGSVNKCRKGCGDIIVSGSHFIRLSESSADTADTHPSTYIQVKDHPDAKKLAANFSELRCLITDSHTIPVGRHVFGDWEDGGELPLEIKHTPKIIKTNI